MDIVGWYGTNAAIPVSTTNEATIMIVPYRTNTGGIRPMMFRTFSLRNSIGLFSSIIVFRFNPAIIQLSLFLPACRDYHINHLITFHLLSITSTYQHFNQSTHQSIIKSVSSPVPTGSLPTHNTFPFSLSVLHGYQPLRSVRRPAPQSDSHSLPYSGGVPLR